MRNDDPIADHYTFSKRCKLLQNSDHTWNVLDISIENEFEKLLSRLPEQGEESSLLDYNYMFVDLL